MTDPSIVQLTDSVASISLWGNAIFGIAMTIVVSQAVICAIVCLAIAAHNERDRFIASIAGFFLGPLGIVMYAIMGETVNLRVHLEQIAMQEEQGTNIKK